MQAQLWLSDNFCLTKICLTNHGCHLLTKQNSEKDLRSHFVLFIRRRFQHLSSSVSLFGKEYSRLLEISLSRTKAVAQTWAEKAWMTVITPFYLDLPSFHLPCFFPPLVHCYSHGQSKGNNLAMSLCIMQINQSIHQSINHSVIMRNVVRPKVAQKREEGVNDLTPVGTTVTKSTTGR